MKLTRLILSNFQQFKYLDLDLTYPEGHEKAGQPLEKVCLIGKNGTGKSTILRRIQDFWENRVFLLQDGSSSLVEFHYEEDQFFLYAHKNETFLGKSSENSFDDLQDRILSRSPKFDRPLIQGQTAKELPKAILEVTEYLKNDSAELLLSSFSESESNPLLSMDFYPNVKAAEAEKWFVSRPSSYQITFDQFNEFWSFLIYIALKREADRTAFENRSENLEKTKSELIREFDEKSPDFFPFLSSLWDEILSDPGLYLDYINARTPVHSSDKLDLQIKLKRTDNPIPISKLSTGIRNLLFRLGYFAAIFHVEEGKEAIALIDEPENDLFPDFQYKLVELYQEASHNAQIFFATHSPIIAGQFDPAERFVLEFDGDGYVTARRGRAAEGDDPNDLLIQDFEVESVMGRKGNEMWERFVELKSMIANSNDLAAKKELMKEYFEIGQAYNFIINEKDEQVFGF